MKINIEKLKEMLEEEKGVLSNENIWLMGASTAEETACHQRNIEQHLQYEALLTDILDILNRREYGRLRDPEKRKHIVELIEFYSYGSPDYAEALKAVLTI